MNEKAKARAKAIESAGYNILIADPTLAPFDFFTDVPSRPYVEAVRDSELEAMEGGSSQSLNELWEQLYGPTRYITVTKGRSAEMALMSILRPSVVITNNLFQTTVAALEKIGATIELAPLEKPGYSNIGIQWLEERLKCGGVDLVYLEAGNNGIAGWPIDLDQIQSVRRLCDKYQVLLGLDATRLLTNCALLNEPIETARKYLANVDVFTSSCAKELLWPGGGIIGIRDADLHRKVFTTAWEGGYLLGPKHAAAGLARGAQYTLDTGGFIQKRVQQVHLLADAIRKNGIETVEPVGGHAVFVVLEKTLLGDGTQAEVRALQAFLYETSGIRAWPAVNQSFNKPLLRLAVPMARYSDDVIRDVAGSLQKALYAASVSGIPRLIPTGAPVIHEFWTRYTRVR